MNKYLVVIWGSETVFMSLVPLSRRLRKAITNDYSIAYDEAMGAEITFPEHVVQECCEHIDNFDSLKNGHIVIIEDDLKELLTSLIPYSSCQAAG